MCHSNRPDAGTLVVDRIRSLMAIGGASVSSSRITGEVSDVPGAADLEGRPGRGRAGDDGVPRGVGRALHRDQVGLAVAALLVAVERLAVHRRARVALVLGHDLLVGRVELVRADLEREAEAAGLVVAPVLGGARGVVELVAVLAGVAVGAAPSRRRAPCRRPRRATCPRPRSPGGRSTRLEKVWLVISVVTWRVDTIWRTFWTSGSENGALPRNVSMLGRCWRRGRPRSRRSCGWGRCPACGCRASAHWPAAGRLFCSMRQLRRL